MAALGQLVNECMVGIVWVLRVKSHWKHATQKNQEVAGTLRIDTTKIIQSTNNFVPPSTMRGMAIQPDGA